MNQATPFLPGNSVERIKSGIAAIRAGRGVLITDDENREK